MAERKRKDTGSYVVVSVTPHSGRTLVAAAVTQEMRTRGHDTGVCVPVTFDGRRELRRDALSPTAELLAHCADSRHNLATLNPWCFTKPQFLTAADTPDSHQPTAQALLEHISGMAGRHKRLITVMPGGLSDPITPDELTIDILRQVDTPLILTAQARADLLSCILTAIQLVQQCGLTIAAVTLNDYDIDRVGRLGEAMPQIIRSRTGVPMPVVIPPDSDTDVSNGQLGPDVCFAVKQLPLKWAR